MKNVMGGIPLVIALVLCSPGCGCEESIEGTPDSTADGEDAPGDGECPDCDDHDPCTVDSCDPVSGECLNDPVDADADGFASMLAPDGVAACPGDDCDDADASVHPGAAEVCMDGVDQDCDTLVDGPRAMLSTVHLKTLASGGGNHDLAWTGSEFVTVWDAEEWFTQINMARVGLDGEIVGGIINLVDVAGTMIEQVIGPSFAWTGSELGISYGAGDVFVTGEPSMMDILFLRASPTGDLIGESPRLNDADTFAWFPDVAWTGSRYGVLWSDGRDDACATHESCLMEIYFSRLDAAGTEIGSESRISDVTGSASKNLDALLWSGSEFIAKWAEMTSPGTGSSYFSRIDVDGVKVGDDVAMTHSGSGLVWTGGEIGSLWQSEESGNVEIYLLRFDPIGNEIGDPVRISDAPHFSGNGAIEWTGSDFAVAWLDGRNTGCDGPPTFPGDCNRDLYFTILDPEGVKLWDEVRITVRETWVAWPIMAWTGSVFGISWFEYSDESGEMETNVSFDVISFCD